MKKYILALTTVAFTVLPASGFAAECIVSESGAGSAKGTLRWALAKAMDGGCSTDDIVHRRRYREFYPSAVRFNVVRWTRSMDVYPEDIIEIGQAAGGDPLVLVADEGAVVKIRGGGSATDRGVVVGGDQVIIDGIAVQGFAGTGMVLTGDSNLIIRARVLANAENGVQVLGRYNRIVDSDISNNGFNGIVVGRTTSASSCTGSMRVDDAGAHTVLQAVSVRGNGGNVIGKNCADADDAAPAACAAIRLEAQQCRALMDASSECDEPATLVDNPDCARLKRERARCAELFAAAGAAPDESHAAAVDAVIRSHIGGNGGFGVLVNAPGVELRGWQPMDADEVRYGMAQPLHEGRYAGSIRRNRSAGVFIGAATAPWLCRDILKPPDMAQIIRAYVAETTFEGNGRDVGRVRDAGLWVNGPHPPRITHLAAVGGGHLGSYVITGAVQGNHPADGVWTDRTQSPAAVRIEVYLAASSSNEGAHVLAVHEGIDAATGSFTVRLAHPLILDGLPVAAPSFVVSYVDTEYGASSPFSAVVGTAADADSDGDGLPDVDEDIDGDGVVGPGESDPANIDTDGDGLTDEEERNHTGRVAALIAAGFVFDNLALLDPNNPDSDGDCLPDGLELGISGDEARQIIERMRTRPRYQLSPTCKTMLAKRSVITLDNVILYDESAPFSLNNIAMMYDLDPSTVTDPTSADTDRDGLKDGEEDWNFNGRRDGPAASALAQRTNDAASARHSVSDDDSRVTIAVAELGKAHNYAVPTGGVVIDTCAGDADMWEETDPANPDSDGDGLKDGDEAGITRDAVLGKNESSALMCDTDDDGVPDGMERRIGTFPNDCDSDGDGLSDGIELGIIHPVSSRPNCAGLQAAGTNMQRPSVLDPLNPDSDGDGLPDGVEDINRNGWVDGDESDPTVADTDGDGVSDYIEMTGDFNGDGFPDFDMRRIANGKNCSPPESIMDLDCDGIPNARDEDSDNDGIPDALEGGWIDTNGNGIPDMYDATADGSSGRGGGGGGGSMPSVTSYVPDEKPKARLPAWALDETGGGACALMPTAFPAPQSRHGACVLLLLPVLVLACARPRRIVRHPS